VGVRNLEPGCSPENSLYHEVDGWIVIDNEEPSRHDLDDTFYAPHLQSWLTWFPCEPLP
jgi:hypothetical protein